MAQRVTKDAQALIIRTQQAVIEYLMEQIGERWTARGYEAMVKRAIKAANKKAG